MRDLILVIHNVRSTHNVGSLLRTADGLGLQKVYMTGITPYPIASDDTRLPHIAEKLTRQIHKTALGAEQTIVWQHFEDVDEVLAALKQDDYRCVALEQAADSVDLPSFKPPEKLALIVGREVEGLEPEILDACDLTLEIPMLGKKESFNVSVAAAMALYHCRFASESMLQ
jgi:23S rRNA (guanosine2251-2'-O)-methyltransferase